MSYVGKYTESQLRRAKSREQRAESIGHRAEWCQAKVLKYHVGVQNFEPLHGILNNPHPIPTPPLVAIAFECE